MYELVTLLQAKRHLRLPAVVSSPPSDADLDLQIKLDQAHALVLHYVNQRRALRPDPAVLPTSPPDVTWDDIVAAWTLETVPYQVQAAILLQTAELWRFRGDEVAGPDTTLGLSAPVRRCLDRLRDPAVS